VVQENPADRLEVEELFRLYRKKAVGEEQAHGQSQSGAVLWGLLGEGALQFVVGERAHPLKIIEDLSDRRGRELVDSHLLTKVFVLEELLRNLLRVQRGERNACGEQSEEED
jgi:hypothetical protein